MTAEFANRSRDPIIDRAAPFLTEVIAQNETPLTAARSSAGTIRSGLAKMGGLSAGPALPKTQLPATGQMLPPSNLHFGASGAIGRQIPQTTLFRVMTRRQIQNIVARAQGETNDEAALRILNDGYKGIPFERFKKELLADPGAQEIIARVVKEVNNPFAGDQVSHFSRITEDLNLDPVIEWALLRQIFKGYEDKYITFQKDRGAFEHKLFVQLLERVAGIPEAKRAAADLATFFKNELIIELRASWSPKLINDLIGNFAGLDSETCVALLIAIRNYPREAVITNLTFLAGKENDWFREAPLADRQRFAKFFAIASYYKGGLPYYRGGFNEENRETPGFDRTILDNTLKCTLRHRAAPKMKFDDLEKGIAGQHGPGVLWFNRFDMSAGNDKLDLPYLTADNYKSNPVEYLRISHSIFLAAGNFAHEESHELGGFVGADGSYKNLKLEYLAYLVEFNAVVGREAKGGEAYALLDDVLFSTGTYKQIYKTLKTGNFESQPMVRLAAAAAGLDPNKATLADVVKFHEEFTKNPQRIIDELNKRPAVYPGDVDGIPDNRDNHCDP